MKINVKKPSLVEKTLGEIQAGKEVAKAVAKSVRETKDAKPIDKKAAAKAAMEKINAKLKTSKIVYADKLPPVPRTPSGYLTFDVVTGGGFSKMGRPTQVKGREHSGKTTILLDTVASVQQAGDIAVWINGEEFDKTYAASRGVDVESLVLIPYADGTTMLEQAVGLMAEGVGDFIALDSIQTIKTGRGLETKIGETGYGSGSPQMWGDFNGKVNYVVSKGLWSGALVWVSQMRAKIATGWAPKGGPTDDGTQINALKHWKCLDVRMEATSYLKDKEDDDDNDAYARHVAVKNEKNKVGPYPYLTGEWDFYVKDRGAIAGGFPDWSKELIMWGRYYGLIENRGTHYDYKGQEMANGLPKLEEWLRDQDNADIAQEIRGRVLARARVYREDWLTVDPG